MQEVIEDFDVISRMSSLQAQHCLTVGSVQHRLNHLWRMIPGGEISIFGDLMLKYDEALLSISFQISIINYFNDHVDKYGEEVTKGGPGA